MVAGGVLKIAFLYVLYLSCLATLSMGVTSGVRGGCVVGLAAGNEGGGSAGEGCLCH